MLATAILSLLSSVLAAPATPAEPAALAPRSLRGWPEQFFLLEAPNRHLACEGPRDSLNLCEDYQDVCVDLDIHQTSADGQYMEIFYRGRDKLNLWKAEGSTYVIYEKDGDGSVRGHCQSASTTAMCKTPPEPRAVIVTMDCQQW